MINENLAHIQPVKPGVSEAGITQVEGINPGDTIATSSFEKLQDNAKVTIAAATPAPASSTPTGAP